VTPEYVPIDRIQPAPPQEPVAPPAIAPVWHTLVLVAAILAISIHGATRLTAAHGPLNRLSTYGFTAAMEVGMLAWVILGLRLSKTPLRSLLGSFSFSFRSIATDLGVALVFWIASLMVLGSIGLAWTGVEAAVTHRATATRDTGQQGKAGQEFKPDASQLETLRTVAQLAPSNGKEIAAWAFLCLLVGFIEETVFRGYLQQQFIRWARGGVVLGVLLSAAVFGGAHAYQGMRNIVMLTVFGVLFSVLALYRRSLRAGMFAHSWHDLLAGLALALLKSTHVI
jgi:membrane protease YdiL (CAAX protease family)